MTFGDIPYSGALKGKNVANNTLVVKLWIFFQRDIVGT